MEQRDYIKRQIEQIGIMLERMFSTLLGLRSGGNTGSVVRQLCGEFKEELDIDIDTLIQVGFSVGSHRFPVDLHHIGVTSSSRSSAPR